MRKLSLTAALLLSLAGSPAMADEITMSGPMAPVPAGMEIPVRGMHMDQVKQMYGQPMSMEDPVGEPPITRWHYKDYSVYFEHQYVIQSVPK